MNPRCHSESLSLCVSQQDDAGIVMGQRAESSTEGRKMGQLLEGEAFVHGGREATLSEAEGEGTIGNHPTPAEESITKDKGLGMWGKILPGGEVAMIHGTTEPFTAETG